MSARQLGAAAAVAAACGDVALATLVAGSPAHAVCQSEVAEQLQTWQASGMLGHVARGRLLVYQLLAGQVGVGSGLPHFGGGEGSSNGATHGMLRTRQASGMLVHVVKGRLLVFAPHQTAGSLGQG
eukprot:765768-Pelagomonas_calceolata.AAC.7